MNRPTANQRPQVPGVDTMPGLGTNDADNPMAWVERLEQTVRKCRSAKVTLSKQRVVGMCILLRLFGRMLVQIDRGDIESARKHLHAVVDQLELEQPQQGVTVKKGA